MKFTLYSEFLLLFSKAFFFVFHDVGKKKRKNPVSFFLLISFKMLTFENFQLFNYFFYCGGGRGGGPLGGGIGGLGGGILKPKENKLKIPINQNTN